jgi:hypothetical protein
MTSRHGPNQTQQLTTPYHMHTSIGNTVKEVKCLVNMFGTGNTRFTSFILKALHVTFLEKKITYFIILNFTTSTKHQSRIKSI